jgi:hypothetical protein
MFVSSLPTAKRLVCVLGVCAFMSIAAGCSRQGVEKFGAEATPADDVGACAFMTSDSCPVPDRAPSVAVARASVPADKAAVASK